MAAVVMPERVPALDTWPACKLCIAGASGFYAPTHKAAQHEISAARSSVSNVRPNAQITRAGEAQRHVYTLRRGWAIQVAQLSDGRRQILNFYIPGDIFDIDALLVGEYPANFAVRALTEVDVCAFPVAAMRDLIDSSPEQMMRYQHYAHRHLARLGRRMADIGQRSAQGRLAQLVLELWERLEERGLAAGGIFETPVRQEHLADALGMTPVHVNRTLRALRASGVIDFDRRTMRIQDVAGLRAIADEH